MIAGFCKVVEETVAQAQKDLERLILARDHGPGHPYLPQQLEAAGAGRAVSFSSLVTVALGAKLLKVTPKAVDLMLIQLGGALPRELTGRRRYRAWGIV
ncbi:MAG: hypothetical protein K0S56_1241 [Microvirga sp.]|jgi:hypothetical protein|nr:hypothetical protein [Microvirga sp.]